MTLKTDLMADENSALHHKNIYIKLQYFTTVFTVFSIKILPR